MAALGAQNARAAQAQTARAITEYDAEVRRLSAAATLRRLERDLAVAGLGEAASRPTLSYGDAAALLEKYVKERDGNELAWEALRKKWLAMPALELQKEINDALSRWIGEKAAEARAFDQLAGVVR